MAEQEILHEAVAQDTRIKELTEENELRTDDVKNSFYI